VKRPPEPAQHRPPYVGAHAGEAAVSDTVASVSGAEVFLVFAVVPGVIYALLAVLSMGRKPNRENRYRSGQPWNYEPVWWSGNPQGQAHEAKEPGPGSQAHEPGAAQRAYGGARGGW
jgi:hypothetical protein